jgi:hypothetical protein
LLDRALSPEPGAGIIRNEFSNAIIKGEQFLVDQFGSLIAGFETLRGFA